MKVKPFVPPLGAEPSSIGMLKGYDQADPRDRRQCCQTTLGQPHSHYCKVRGGRCPRCGRDVRRPGLCGQCEYKTANGRP